MEYHIINRSKPTAQHKATDAIKKIASTNKTKTRAVKNKSMKPSSRSWLLRHINDPFVQQAKRDNLISRASYKIIEINNKHNFLRKPSIVVDIGSAPGGWSRAIWNEIAHKHSRLISIDLLDIVFRPEQDEFPENVCLIKGDFTENKIMQEIQSVIPDKADVILSDMAPNTTGHNKVDHLAITELVREFINFTRKNLKEGGTMIFKIFDGEETAEIIKEMRKDFAKVKPIKPTTSRKNSPEIYIIGLQYNVRPQRG